MKKNIIYKSLWLAFLTSLLALGSCRKFLTEKPTSQFTADFVYNTPEGLEAGVVGLYSLQRAFWENLSNNGSNPIVLDAKDDLTINRNAEVANYGRMFCGTNPDNDCGRVYSDYWRTYYRITDRANAIIKAAENLEDIDDNRRDRIIAEAKFFRANSIFILYKLFNNIYVTTEPTTPENAQNLINDKTPVAEIYQQVNSDLIFAIDHLVWKPAEFGRVSQAAARHLKAEVALWQQDWAEAKAQSEAVINSGFYSLLNQTGLVFKGELNHSETIWALQWKAQVNGTPHKINFNLMPNYAELIPGSKYSIEQGGRGFGWLTLNNYLRNLLNAYGTDTRIKGSYYIQDYVYNDPATIPANQTLGTKIEHATWKEFAPLASDRNFWFIRLNAGCKKYFPDNGIPTEDLQTKNVMMQRLAETHLYASEANLMLGDQNAALFHLNKVRTRAGIPAANEITIDSILNEQAKELAFEGRRLYMLKRLGILYDYIVNHAGYGMPGDLSPENSTAGGANNTPERPLPYRTNARTSMKPWMVNWVIPRRELELLGPNYPQNDGY